MQSQLWILLLLFTVAAGTLLGGNTEISVKKALEEYPEAVKFANDGFNDWLDKNAAPDMKQEQFTLVGAKKQVVQGIELTVTFQSQTYTCIVGVWYRSWLVKDGSGLKLQGPNCSHKSA